MSHAHVHRAGQALMCGAVLVLAGCTAPDGGTDVSLPSSGVRVVARTPGLAEPPACKIGVAPLGSTPPPPWGRDVGTWISSEAFVVDDVLFTTRCDVRVPLSRGRYRLTVSHGPEFDVGTETVRVGRDVREVEVPLSRAFPSSRWACADLHVHSAPSFDSVVPKRQRLVSAEAEGLDAIVPSDHDVVAEWSRPLREAGLEDRLAVIRGDELTPDQWERPRSIGHVNVYPLPEDFDASALTQTGPTMGALVDAASRVAPDALLQMNHPRWNRDIGYLEHLGFDARTLDEPEGETIMRFDTIEIWNGHALHARGGGSTFAETWRDWTTLLNAGVPLVGTANSDTHHLGAESVGYPRTCVRVPDDRAPPDELAQAVVEGLRAGSAIGTSGPLLSITVDGVVPGSLVEVASEARVDVHVDAASWVHVDDVALWMGGREVRTASLPDELPQTVTWEVPITEDTWIAAIAEGDEPLGAPAGDRRHPLIARAFTNPVFVDADADAMWTPPDGS